ncbi:MAG: hypothetical protein QOH76_1696 [Thermoleophilaceae bacterium]|nr:hypothetical protein [Thermoleophilaceae bacterium]
MRGKAWIGATCGLLALAAAMPAHAADPGRWKETGRDSVPLYYYQGVTSDPAKNLYFDGVHVGLYKTDSSLNELARHDDEIPAQVHLNEGYDHMGDLTWDPAEGGRLLLPLECYYPYPGAPNSGNTCGFGANGQPEPGTGSFGVADPDTLDWRYYVKLDQRDILKAMWAEVSPDGKLVWTSAGKDLLAYSTADIKPQNAAPGGPKLRPVRRLAGAVPPSGVTGAAFEGERLLVAGQDGGGPFQVWSIDLGTGARELQIERTIVGESEGIDTVDALGGTLHWLIQPYNEQSVPTYGVTNGTLLNFVRASTPGPGAQPPPCCAPKEPPPSGGPPKPAPRPPARIRLAISPRRVVARRLVRFRVRTTVVRDGRVRPVARARVHFAGKLFKTNGQGRAQIVARLRVTGRREGRASHSGLRKGYAWIYVRRR